MRMRSVWHEIHELQERMEAMEASQAQNQASIDADTAAVQALGPKLDTIAAEVAALKANPTAQSLDFSALDKAIADATGKTDADVAAGA